MLVDIPLLVLIVRVVQAQRQFLLLFGLFRRGGLAVVKLEALSTEAPAALHLLPLPRHTSFVRVEEDFQVGRDLRTGRLEGPDDVRGVAFLLRSEEGVGKALFPGPAGATAPVDVVFVVVRTVVVDHKDQILHV